MERCDVWRSNEAARGSSGGNGLFGRPHGCSIMAAMLSGYDYRSSQTPSYAPSYAPSRPPSYATVESSARSIYTPGLTAFRAGPRRDPLSRETHVLSMAQTGRSMNLPTATGPLAKNTFGAGLDLQFGEHRALMRLDMRAIGDAGIVAGLLRASGTTCTPCSRRIQ